MSLELVIVRCPDCRPLPENSRAERRAAIHRAKSCSMCQGTGAVSKSIPVVAPVDQEGPEGSADE
jgi:hypothetical protein